MCICFRFLTVNAPIKKKHLEFKAYSSFVAKGNLKALIMTSQQFVSLGAAGFLKEKKRSKDSILKPMET